MKKYNELVVREEKTVEKVLRQEGGFSKAQIRRAKFQEDGILKNKRRCRVNELAKKGDCISILLEAGENSHHILPMEEVTQGGKLQVIYEDQWILAVEKPAGLVTHPQGGHYKDTLVNQVAAYFAKRGELHRIRPIGRLDKETSGIVVFAKDQVTAARLQEQRETGKYQKTYVAVVHGKMEIEEEKEQILEDSIRPDPENPLKMQLHPEGKRARTRYCVIQATEQYSVVKVQLDTGRTHQIRVHMAGMNHPLLGDQLYGKKEETGKRALLHAWKVTMYHPFLKEELEWTAKIPKDMHEFCSFS